MVKIEKKSSDSCVPDTLQDQLDELVGKRMSVITSALEIALKTENPLKWPVKLPPGDYSTDKKNHRKNT